MSSPSPGSSPPTNSTTSPPPSSSTPSAPPPSTPTTPPPSSTPTTPPPSSTPTTPPPVASSPPPPPPPAPITPPPTSTPSTPPPTPSTSPATPSVPATSPPRSSPPSPPGGSTPALSPPITPSGGSTPAVRSPPPVRPSPSAPSRPSGSSPSSGTGSANNSSGGISTGVIVGVVVAGVVIIAILGIVCLLCTRKKKKKNRRDEYGGGGYYVPPPPSHPAPPGPKDGHYGVQAQQWQQNYPPPAEHYYQVPKPPPPAGPYHPPGVPSPPLTGPPYMSSGGASGSSFGSENPLGSLPPPSPGISLGSSKSMFSYEELALATNGFSESNLLGQGGFGYVHKGVLPNGKEVAVKALKAGSGQGEREFQAEVEIISRVHHRYLVSLVGYCITGSQRLLVYEFVPNGTLEFHLHGKGRPPMDWQMRLKIALGAAKGLAYLHEDCNPKIIHRDIKAANILVDYKFEAKVADFGLAKLSSDANTHISTRVMGTFGYLAPEYASSGKLTEKSDVYSFGVMLLELITGRKPVDQTHTYAEDSLVDWARPLLTKALEENNFDSLVDQRLDNNFNPSEMARMVACAAACVRHSARRRPRMSQVVRALEGEASLSDLNEGVKPGHSSIYSSSDYDSGQYKEDMKKFRQMALASQQLGVSSEYGGTTSEYGLNPSGSSGEPQTNRGTTSKYGVNPSGSSSEAQTTRVNTDSGKL